MATQIAPLELTLPTMSDLMPSSASKPKLTPAPSKTQLQKQRQSQQSLLQQQPEFSVPVSKSFAFSIADLWKPTKDSLLQWINELPGPVKREEPLEPAHFQAPKHALDPDGSYAGSSTDGHRDKRAKLGLGLAHHPAVESRRRRLVQSGKGFMRRVSHACQRVMAPGHAEQQDAYDGSTIRGSTSLPGTPGDRAKMRFVFVGDSECGKSSLLLRYYRDTFTLHYSKTQYELFNKTVEVDDQEVDLELWDTCGEVRLHQLQLLSYLAWDAIFLCFSVNSMKRFESAKTKWINEIRMYCRDAPIILVGLKKDMRVGSGLWAPLFPRVETRIGASQGTLAANGMGAVKYMECSAKTGEGVANIFEDGIRVVFDERAADAEAARLREKHAKKGENKLGQLLCFA
ncbi:Uu.00g093400.m01.CDS01 [Anthostomella pinea]|uniref:Uu.00g093400.m01.CDS01 n=1 Tax=Anthostomella pinea TaxID=933095 RepID=A0AAI8VNF3_9PEZI|nr:Uu.00g093400.m01.CDS01 [Anthostomella pinea]